MATAAAELGDRAASVASIAAPAQKSQLTRSRVRAAWLFLTPMLILLVMVAGWPLFRTIWFSFTDANLSDLSNAKFIGFENYLAYNNGEWYGVLADGEWWNAVWNTLKFSAISVTLETIFGMVVALVLNASFPGRSLAVSYTHLDVYKRQLLACHPTDETTLDE